MPRVGLWLLIFGVCGVYLMHRNGFSVNSHPLLRPIVTVWLSWTVAATQFTIGNKVSVRAADDLGEPPMATVELAQQDLTRLLLGTFPVDDALDRLGLPPDPTARRWLEVLYPQRHPYVHPPDRI
jgi:hypothetical protein